MAQLTSSNLTDNTLLVRNPDLIGADMDGEMVMMSINKGAYYGINNIGSRIWNLLENEMTALEIINNICDTYEVEIKQAHKDTMAFLNNLLEHDLVMIVK